ncbi:hypothetical protein THRCLA_08658 [Thraustotheca clavata]|uniref:FYVE-type domain-containing protein n=1 Tax=Thraustotheca clavata TaxID=74557 RepID=A0A1V9Z3W6_9STRA|nr:hypothetical protein THRCLA_08658 [Thraustotheca clavata]
MWCFPSNEEEVPSLQRATSKRRFVVGTTQPPPTWELDEIATTCTACKVEFDLFHRKHHCRACGLLFCGTCASGFEKILGYGLTTQVRVCQSCIPIVTQENKFHEVHLPLLRTGETFVKHGMLLERNVKLILIDNSLQYQTINIDSMQVYGETKIILLENVSSIASVDIKSLMIKTPGRNHKLDASSSSIRDSWVKALESALAIFKNHVAMEDTKHAKALAKEHAEMNRIMRGLELIELRRLEMQQNRLQQNSSRRDELRLKYGLAIPAPT